ncbi:MAG: protein kinase [Planctomycetaceae bacterium]
MTRCKDLFAEAAGLLPSDRAAMLDRACSDDPELRSEVERLLAAFDGAGDFLESSAIERSSITRLLDRTGTRIGNYIVREPLGEGGMGVVWKAEQTAPVRREVALKLLKPGTESRQVLARFETERRALERMEHPNIARVLDAGTTDSGRPYVVMELVRGVAVTTFCDARRMSILDRLGLFVLVCRAVQHAHAKGIIHRDLKPSNILVADDGRTVTPKIIDFSIARAIDRAADETSYTRSLMLLGTPSYVSPEQAVGSADTDTRTDIYSLGAVLYELLCGVPPFGEQELSRLATDEFLRRLQQDDPVRPSRRSATLEDVVAIADARRSTPAVLRRCLEGDLDRIVMKALDKEPARRYETAAAFADDLERFARHEPVSAVRPSARYHALKFARRHRAGLVAAALILVSVLGGAAVSTWQAFRAAASEERYRREAYVSDLNLADDALRSDDPRRMRVLLDRHIPGDGEEDLRGFAWHYLYRHCTAPGRLIDRFDGAAYFACLSPAPEQRWLAASGADGTVRLYDTRSWKRTKVIRTGQTEVNGVGFSPDGTQIASAGDDGTVRQWDVASGKLIRSIDVFDQPAFQVVYAQADGRSLLAVCGSDPAIKLFDAATGRPRGELVSQETKVEAIAVFADQRLAAASDDGVPRVWDLAKRELLLSWPDMDLAALTSAAFSPNGRFIAFGTLQQNYVLCRAHSSQPPRSFPINSERPGEGEGTQSLAFGPDGDALFTADRGGTVRVSRFDDKEQPYVDLADGRFPRWAAHDERVYSVAVTNDGTQVITACADGTLSVWRPYEAPDVWTVPTKTIPYVVDIAIGPNGLVAVAGDEAVDLYHTRRGLRQRVTHQPGGKFHTVEIRSDGRVILTATQDGRLAAWTRDDGRITNTWETNDPDGADAVSLALSADGRHVAVVLNPRTSSPRRLRLLDAATGDILRAVSVASASDVVFSPDGTMLAVDRDNDVLLYDVPSMSIRHELIGHSQSVEAVVFSPDGRRLASGGLDRYVILWDVETGTIAERWLVQDAGIRSLAFGPRGESILSTGDDLTPRITDLQTGRLLLRFPRLADEHWPMQFLPDGQMVVGRNAAKGFYVFDGRPFAAGEQPAAIAQPEPVR